MVSGKIKTDTLTMMKHMNSSLVIKAYSTRIMMHKNSSRQNTEYTKILQSPKHKSILIRRKLKM